MLYFMGAGSDFNIPLQKTILQLMLITLIPVALGMLVRAKFAKTAYKLEAVFNPDYYFNFIQK